MAYTTDRFVREVRVTPILITDPPLLNLSGVHQPLTPRTVVEVETEGGHVGLGETYGDTEYLTAIERVAARLAGTDVSRPTALRALIDDVLGHDDAAATAADVPASGLRGKRDLAKLKASVFSVFEVAYLDAWGRLLGVPVHALLGGKVRDRVDYSAYLFYKWAGHPGAEPDAWGAALDPQGVVEQARLFIDRYGFGSIKLKGGAFEPDQEIAAMHALRAAFPHMPLRLDPNGAWSVETGLRVARELTGVLEYLEDPSAGTDAMSRIHAETDMPLATNMCVTGFDEVPDAFAKNAVQVVLSDHHYWGGLRATLDLAALCRTHGVSVSMHSNTHLGISLAAMTHVAAAVPNLEHACDTHRPWQDEDVITRPHTFTGGAVEVSDDPGLGIELDTDALADLHRRWKDSDVRDRDDVAAMRAADPDWTAPRLPRW
ncbi:glucarate dehydratase [Streptomonospora sp. S1-112]|uniref:glucarate dehydratase n=1 Tax=Streptomonospora mangrovi TaxID=2883123 RepID=A0A9X3NJ52_9ACTN|nr:enolase C-terminal domain-like protein [Streptomonospora mangrovi]MDA0564814.1 glucarate dehydratase [Streptomonospora mangrovi]